MEGKLYVFVYTNQVMGIKCQVFSSSRKVADELIKAWCNKHSFDIKKWELSSTNFPSKALLAKYSKYLNGKTIEEIEAAQFERVRV